MLLSYRLNFLHGLKELWIKLIVSNFVAALMVADHLQALMTKIGYIEHGLKYIDGLVQESRNSSASFLC